MALVVIASKINAANFSLIKISFSRLLKEILNLNPFEKIQSLNISSLQKISSYTNG